MSFTKLVEVPDKYLNAVPSDFVRSAQRVMALIGKNPPGPMIECHPAMDEDGQYLLPSWTIHYMVGAQQCHITFVAPFRYMHNLAIADSTLSSLFGAMLGGSAPAPSAAFLKSKAGQYEARVISDSMEEDKARYAGTGIESEQ